MVTALSSHTGGFLIFQIILFTFSLGWEASALCSLWTYTHLHPSAHHPLYLFCLFFFFFGLNEEYAAWANVMDDLRHLWDSLRLSLKFQYSFIHAEAIMKLWIHFYSVYSYTYHKKQHSRDRQTQFSHLNRPCVSELRIRQ